MKSIIRTLTLFNKKRRVRNLIRTLLRDLYNKHGKSRFYTYQKVNVIAEDNYVDLTYIHYAIALLCNSKNFNIFCNKVNTNYDYKSLRKEVLLLVNRGEISQFQHGNSTEDFDVSTSNDE